MAKAYWVSVYHAIHDQDKLAAYAKLAGPAVEAGGGKFIARGMAAKAYEAGMLQRTKMWITRLVYVMQAWKWSCTCILARHTVLTA